MKLASNINFYNFTTIVHSLICVLLVQSLFGVATEMEWLEFGSILIEQWSMQKVGLIPCCV